MFVYRDKIKFTTTEVSLMLNINRIFFDGKDIW